MPDVASAPRVFRAFVCLLRRKKSADKQERPSNQVADSQLHCRNPICRNWCMSSRKLLRIYLHPSQRDDARAGKHNFLRIVTETFEDRGFKVEFRENSSLERLMERKRGGYALFLDQSPVNTRSAVLRLAYLYPFWRIERSLRRKDWLVTGKEFQAPDAPTSEIRRFFRFWQGRSLVEATTPFNRKGYVLVPLQARLTVKRAGQQASPLEMVRSVLRHDTEREVLVSLHPRVTYSAQELAELESVLADKRVSRVQADMHALLAACDYVVTENSSVAFHGILHRKPAVLFADIDFHHIFESVSAVGEQEAFRRVLTTSPPYEDYFYWFLQQNMINAGREFATARIVEVCRELGWEL